MTDLVVVAVEAEARALSGLDGVRVVVAGIGRTNAACATTEAILEARPRTVISAGVAGALPGSAVEVGDVVIADSCVYAEEGLLTAEGFRDIRAIGFPLGDFEGNRVPVDAGLLATWREAGQVGPIATVATCSGTDALADEIARRTGAIAEAMEGAAVVHAARRLGVPAIEVRAISNRTGERDRQGWDLDRALNALGAVFSNRPTPSGS